VCFVFMGGKKISLCTSIVLFKIEHNNPKFYGYG
jgi:hypothetical protein